MTPAFAHYDAVLNAKPGTFPRADADLIDPAGLSETIPAGALIRVGYPFPDGALGWQAIADFQGGTRPVYISRDMYRFLSFVETSK